jgi:hypothetical protein
MQRNRGLRIIDLMAATEGSDFNAVETSSLDQTQDSVLLLWRRHSIIVPGTNVNWRIKKVCAGLTSRISVTKVVFIRAGHVNSNDVTTVSHKKRRNITNAFTSPGKTCARHRPLLRPGKAPVKRVDGSHCHRCAPRRRIVPRMLRAIPRK